MTNDTKTNYLAVRIGIPIRTVPIQPHSHWFIRGKKVTKCKKQDVVTVEIIHERPSRPNKNKTRTRMRKVTPLIPQSRYMYLGNQVPRSSRSVEDDLKVEFLLREAVLWQRLGPAAASAQTMMHEVQVHLHHVPLLLPPRPGEPVQLKWVSRYV